MALLECGSPCDTEVDVYAVAKGLRQLANLEIARRLSGPAWGPTLARMAVVERVPLSRERIADTALRFIDDHGLDRPEHAQARRRTGRRSDVALQPRREQGRPPRLGRQSRSTPGCSWRTATRRATGGPRPVGWRRATSRSHRLIRRRIAGPVEPARRRRPARLGVPGSRVVAIFDDVTEDLRVAALAFAVVANWVVGTLVQQFDATLRCDAPEPAVAGFERVAAVPEGAARRDRARGTLRGGPRGRSRRYCLPVFLPPTASGRGAGPGGYSVWMRRKLSTAAQPRARTPRRWRPPTRGSCPGGRRLAGRSDCRGP